jgi:hypothetical protein
MKKLLVGFLCTMCVLFLFSTNASALSITPDDAILWGNDTSQNDIDEAIATTIGTAEELYKNEVDGGQEYGSLMDSYETTYFNDPNDPEGALIEYVGGPFIDPNSPSFLLVKDGNQTPAWYLFDLYALLWNGTDDLELDEFWPDQGAISHVSLYGGEGEGTPPVPEPATMLLLGSGLVGLAGFGRKKFKK